MQAATEVRRAWEKGEPGILSLHRVQLSSLDPDVAAAGRRQLRACLRELLSDGPVRFLVDDEVAQLRRRRWSRCERGDRVVVRNHSGGAIRVAVFEGERERVLAPGTHVFSRGGPEPRSKGTTTPVNSR